MKSYATAFYAVAAAQGVMAKLPAGEQLAPDRLPALQDDHVAKVQVPSKWANACYQNSGGQVLERDAAGKPSKVLKYPCISAQEIFGYCQQAEFNNDVEAQKQCLFGKGSTLESDYEGCVKCEEYNGLGSVEYIKATRQRIVDVKKAYLGENKKFSDVDSKFPFPDPAVGTPIKSQAEIAANGTADINILSYWNDYVLPQQAGAPIPTDKKEGGKTDGGAVAPKQPSDWKTTQKTFSLGYYASLSVKSQTELKASAKFRNDSSSGLEEAFLWVKQDYQLDVCISNAAPGLDLAIDWESRLEISSKMTNCVAIQEKPVYESAQVVSFSSSLYASLKANVLVNIDECACFEKDVVKDVKIENKAAVGDGKKFVATLPTTQPAVAGKTPEAPKAASNDGKAPAAAPKAASNDGKAPAAAPKAASKDGKAPEAPEKAPANEGQAPSTKAAAGNNGAESSGAKPVAPPAPVSPSTPAPSGVRNATAPVTVSGGSAMRASSLIVAVGALVAAL